MQVFHMLNIGELVRNKEYANSLLGDKSVFVL